MPATKSPKSTPKKKKESSQSSSPKKTSKPQKEIKKPTPKKSPKKQTQSPKKQTQSPKKGSQSPKKGSQSPKKNTKKEKPITKKTTESPPPDDIEDLQIVNFYPTGDLEDPTVQMENLKWYSINDTPNFGDKIGVYLTSSSQKKSIRKHLLELGYTDEEIGWKKRYTKRIE